MFEVIGYSSKEMPVSGLDSFFISSQILYIYMFEKISTGFSYLVYFNLKKIRIGPNFFLKDAVSFSEVLRVTEADKYLMT